MAKPLGGAIQRELNAIGVRFERWQQADGELGKNPDAETVITAYQHAINRLVAEKGYQSWDVISMRPDNPHARGHAREIPGGAYPWRG